MIEALRQYGWLPAGLGVAAAVAAWFGSARAWAIIGGYVLFNGLGTVYVVWRARIGPAGPRPGDSMTAKLATARKICFVLQLPLGLLLLMLEGL